MIAKQPQPASNARFPGIDPIRTASLTLLWFAFCLAQSTPGDVWISEFLADNQHGLRTRAGDAADWIELANNGSQAVDLSGWYLTDQASTPTKWRIPDGTTIPTNGYVLIFADSSLISVTNGELHANFSLSKDGEYLGLVRPDGVTVSDEFGPRFPPQLTDISYGSGAPQARELVGESTPMRYRIPDAGGTAPWANATGALGFSSTNGAFTVRYYEMNSSIANVDAAESMVADSGYWKTDATYPIVGHVRHH